MWLTFYRCSQVFCVCKDFVHVTNFDNCWKRKHVKFFFSKKPTWCSPLFFYSKIFCKQRFLKKIVPKSQQKIFLDKKVKGGFYKKSVSKSIPIFDMCFSHSKKIHDKERKQNMTIFLFEHPILTKMKTRKMCKFKTWFDLKT